MASNSRLYTFVNDKVVNPTKLEVELSNIINFWNNHEQGLQQHTITWTGAMVLGLSVKTTSGNYDVLSSDSIVVVNKGTGSATQVNFPATPSTGRYIIVKDGKGDAATNNITVSGNGKNIDGSSTNIISTNLQARHYAYNGTQWNIL